MSKNNQRCKLCKRPITPYSDTVESTEFGTVHRTCVEYVN